MDKSQGPMQTDWSMIAAAISARRHDDDRHDRAAMVRAEEAMERLARRYWPAVYAYIRRSGRDVHEAADLTQGFICDVVLGGRLLELADPERGRFRSLLLTALQNYLRRDHATRARRGLRARAASSAPESAARNVQARSNFSLSKNELDAVEPRGVSTPESAFAAQWSAMLVRGVLERVREACLADGLETHWIIFENRVVRPILFGDAPTPHATLMERLDLESPSQCSNMLVTVKRRFARALYHEICETIGDSREAEEELFDLLRDLER